MDIETLAICKKLAASAVTAANTAAETANAAAEDAESAISAIYHDKTFLLTVNEDGSLSLTYNDETEE